MLRCVFRVDVHVLAADATGSSPSGLRLCTSMSIYTHQPYISNQQAPFSLRVPQRTCIVSLGESVSRHPSGWFPVSSGTTTPFPDNYRAICWLNKHLVFLSVSIADSGLPSFHAVLSSGSDFAARTPTALVTTLGIALRDPTPFNGLDAFGFAHPLVQHALWRRFGAQCPQPMAPPMQSQQQLPAHLHLQLGDLLRMLQGTALAPTIAPPIRTVERPLSGIDVLAEVASHEAQHVAGGLGRTSPRSAGPPLIRGPRYVFWGQVCCSSCAMAKLVVTKKKSVFFGRGGGGPLSQGWDTFFCMCFLVVCIRCSSLGHVLLVECVQIRSFRHRGWTAFTAFGMANREQVRRDNPSASATQIEKVHHH